jgi:hypothetical protein
MAILLHLKKQDNTIFKKNAPLVTSYLPTPPPIYTHHPWITAQKSANP